MGIAVNGAARSIDGTRPVEQRHHCLPQSLATRQCRIGALAAEFLLLGIDPYPRKPGAEFTPLREDNATATPFAALTKLKDAKN